MTHVTDFITAYSWEDILTTLFVMIDDLYKAWYGSSNRPRRRGPEPEFADSEMITVALFVDTFFQGNEELALATLKHQLKAIPQKSHRRSNRWW